jgi:hypothetical protein
MQSTIGLFFCFICLSLGALILPLKALADATSARGNGLSCSNLPSSKTNSNSNAVETFFVQSVALGFQGYFGKRQNSAITMLRHIFSSTDPEVSDPKIKHREMAKGILQYRFQILAEVLSADYEANKTTILHKSEEIVQSALEIWEKSERPDFDSAYLAQKVDPLFTTSLIKDPNLPERTQMMRFGDLLADSGIITKDHWQDARAGIKPKIEGSLYSLSEGAVQNVTEILAEHRFKKLMQDIRQKESLSGKAPPHWLYEINELWIERALKAAHQKWQKQIKAGQVYSVGTFLNAVDSEILARVESLKSTIKQK